MERKKYSRPAVESETVLEQTSLACTATEAPSEPAIFAYWCDGDVSKGENFDSELPCDVLALDEIGCVVLLS